MFVYGYKPVYSLAVLSDPDPLDDDKLTSLSESLEPKFNLPHRTKNKRITNSDLMMEKNKSGLTPIFLDFIKYYGNAHYNEMSLKDRIKLIKEQYIPVHLVKSSKQIERSLEDNYIDNSSKASRFLSFSEDNDSKKDNPE